MNVKILLILVTCTFVFGSDVYPCTTPDYEASSCISLFSCPGLMKVLGTLEKSLVQFVHKSICPIGGAGELFVCCGKENRKVSNTTEFRKPTPEPKPTPKPTPPVTPTKSKTTPKQKLTKEEYREMVKKTLIPDLRYCGRQHTDDRFYNQSQTALDEFPWLVHIKITDLEYEMEYGDRCSGVLISSRYVLTDAYCAYDAKKVIVGEHKTDTNVSCVVDSDLPECTEPTYEVRVEDMVRDGKRENGPYDFALLRLKEHVSFSDYIRPLCLPFNQTDRPQMKEVLIFSGWGSQGPGVSVKKRVVYDQAANKECYDAETWLEGNVKFANVTHLCIKPRKGNTDLGCSGDHGGALMYSRKAQWFAEAIVIKVFPEGGACSDSIPASSIKITPKTLTWILDSLKP